MSGGTLTALTASVRKEESSQSQDSGFHLRKREKQSKARNPESDLPGLSGRSQSLWGFPRAGGSS